MKRRKPIIGLCGGIGAGKSLVAAEFERAGCLVIASDHLGHEVLREADVLDEIRSWWGSGVIGPDGGPNHAAIAEIVFADPEQKRRLESLIHPLIARRREDIIHDVENHPAIKAIVLDSPLLFESNLDRQCDTIVFVDADHRQRLERLMRTRRWDEGELSRREQWQMPLAEKRARSQYVIRNEGSVDDLRAQIVAVLEQVLKRNA